MVLQKKKYGIFDMFILPYRVSPFYSTVFILQHIINALIPTFMIFVTADFVNSALAVFNKTADMSSIHRPISMLTIVMVYTVLNTVSMSFVYCRYTIHCRKRLIPEIVEKRAKLEYRHIENQKTADLINRVCPNFDNNIKDMYYRVLESVENVFFVAGIIITLFTQVWWIALAITAAGFPIIYLAGRAGKKTYDADKEMSKVDRRVEYLSDVLRSRDAVDERSIYGYTAKLNSLYGERFEHARKFRLKVTFQNFIRVKMGGIVSSSVSIAVMLALLQPVTRGELDYGMFIGLTVAVIELSRKLSWGVNWLAEELARKREYLKDLTEFMMLDEKSDANALPKGDMSFYKLEFKDVSFKYPGTDILILDKVSFVIEQGEHYSFVGINGAGKTTIVKLITGLYTNYEGDILVDGRSLRDLPASEIKGLSSVIYQDFARYNISLKENIEVGCLGGQDNGEEIERAIGLVGLTKTVERLPDGIDTPLGKIQEKGVDISSGEWQRAAMARSILSPAPLRILDEPTAALDPVAESMVYKKFEEITKGRTTVFISHRLGSTKLADTIYVLSDGRIIEQGSHDELMADNGVYCEMFTSQAEWYAADTAKGRMGFSGETEATADA